MRLYKCTTRVSPLKTPNITNMQQPSSTTSTHGTTGTSTGDISYGNNQNTPQPYSSTTAADTDTGVRGSVTHPTVGESMQRGEASGISTFQAMSGEDREPGGETVYRTASRGEFSSGTEQQHQQEPGAHSETSPTLRDHETGTGTTAAERTEGRHVGVGDKIIGSVEKVAGKVTRNPDLEARGVERKTA
ncbi:unnamed protein product [Mycena citricolor]|uniref:Uncharacterized protein n=1 Tax=Mycena citricolor TaxID=2018698 RepID=A0AAD2H7L1_9AGAR|nr:unnamed protein product [Mycena citricolor]